MRMYDIIEKKRDGGSLTYEELEFFIEGYCKESIPDYQAAALLMAIYLNGLDSRETSELTMLMAESGGTIDLSVIPGIKVDKHSTGGVGDKTTLVVAPIVAACGIPVAKMSGRGLGHTGGTIDKLESIPGFRTMLPIEEFKANVREIGLSVAGQTGNLVPADKKLYALRDVTATVSNISLIASSIMSKKIASGADRILLDVKTGSGAFMKSLGKSVELASAMVDIGKKVGRATAAIVTDMDVPLGNAIGNSLEVIEAIETLKGKGPEDLRELCLEISAGMLELAGEGTAEECRAAALRAIVEGRAIEKLEQMIKRQGGDTGVLSHYDRFAQPEVRHDVISDEDGFIQSIRTDRLGTAAMMLGAGRETKDSVIDYSAGIILRKKRGEKVKKGDAVATLCTCDRSRLKQSEDVLKSCYTLTDEKPQPTLLIQARIYSDGSIGYMQ